VASLGIISYIFFGLKPFYFYLYFRLTDQPTFIATLPAQQLIKLVSPYGLIVFNKNKFKDVIVCVVILDSGFRVTTGARKAILFQKKRLEKLEYKLLKY